MGSSKTPQGLTAKQEQFCQNIISGMSQYDAYVIAYNAKNMSRKTVDETASKMMKNPKISPRIRELKELATFMATQKTSQELIWTREMSIKALAGIYKDPNAPHSAKVSAVKEINAMHGYNEAIKLNLGGQKDNPILLQKIERIIVHDDSQD
jgi:hypothetical protein